MAGGGVDGLALGTVAAGGLFLYAAIQGKTILGSVQALIQGKSPATAKSANSIPIAADIASAASSAAGSTTLGGSPVANTGSVQSILQQTAAQRGWGSGAEWQALQNIEIHEAGYNPFATNPSSKAFGIAQAYGHGNGAATQGTHSNMYGGYGLTDAQAQAANSGDAAMQALWMCNYIADTYGTPSAAWAQYFNHPGGVGSY